MDSDSLKTASEYLNNLLLARGLLRDSAPIDFVKPSRDSRAQIINLVHDLILRGDRDKEQRERTAHALKQVRADEESRSLEIERLYAKQEEAARSTVQAQTAERVAKEELKKIEKSIRVLQEQNSRLKTTLTQVKTQCSNDVKKRDLELTRLKTHLQGHQRGNRTATVAPSITVIAGVRKPAFDTTVHDTSDPAYTLRQESNEFLTQLSHDLSEENDRLLNIVRGSLLTLRDLLGLQQHQASTIGAASDSGIGEDIYRLVDGKLPTSFEALASDLETTLAHLKSLLTNPNFVSIEEVEVREQEILRMRADWEKMEQRWHDLLSMMNGWRRRMDTGGSINKDDLRKGMKMVSPSHETSEPTISHFSTMITSEQDNSLVDDSIEEIRRETTLETRNVKSKDHSRIPTLSGLVPGGPMVSKQRIEEQPAIDTLKQEIEQKAGAVASDLSRNNSKDMSLDRKHASHTMLQQQQQHTIGDSDGRVSPKRKRDPLEPPESFDLRPRGTVHTLRSSRDRASVNGRDQHRYILDELDNGEESEELEIPRLTIEEKLSAAADEAAVMRVNNDTLPGTAEEAGDLVSSMTAGNNKLRKPAKLNGRPKKRKSTLSRDELDSLLNASARS